jgi:hypothetical protein
LEDDDLYFASKEKFDSTKEYKKGSVVWFPAFDYWFRANCNRPDGVVDDHWEELTDMLHGQEEAEEEEEEEEEKERPIKKSNTNDDQ